MVYCTAIRHGDDADYHFMEMDLLKFKDHTVKEYIYALRAMSCSRSQDLLRTSIYRVIYDEDPYARIPETLTQMTKSVEGQKAIFDFFSNQTAQNQLG